MTLKIEVELLPKLREDMVCKLLHARAAESPPQSPLRARYEVSCSSFRVNLGTAFAPLLHGEGKRINVVFKLFKGVFKMFYKKDGKPRYPPQIKRLDYEDGFSLHMRKRLYKTDRCTECGTATRKKGRKNGNGGSQGLSLISKVSSA